MIPFTAESLDQLRARYPLALTTLHDQVAILAGSDLPPSKFPQNKFDFESGLRLFVSRECAPDGQRVLHLSASVEPGTPFYHRLARLREEQMHDTRSLEELHQMQLSAVMALRAEMENVAVEHFRILSGDRREVNFWRWTEGLIPHWYIPEK